MIIVKPSVVPECLPEYSEIVRCKNCGSSNVRECGALLKDRKGFETKTARCPKCGAEVVEFVGLYEDE